MYPLAEPSFTYGNTPVSPEDLYGSLFQDVQNSHIFEDSKTFADAVPLQDPAWINEKYQQEKDHPEFDLAGFVNKYFRISAHILSPFEPDHSRSVSEHIERLWPVLTRQPEEQERGGSLIPLPEPYVVPGGRFREIYYWDTYFTMLGLKESGKTELMGHMINNFAYLIESFGFIPTANRTYYLSRSQPPFFSLMVKLYSEVAGKQILKKYLPHMQREYDYWMDAGDTNGDFSAHRRLVKLPDGNVLNRYWDDKCTPRPESYIEDVELGHEAFTKHKVQPEVTCRHIRAAAESGWDFSSRWFADENDFATIHTTDILPVDLNCLMYFLEKTLAEAYRLEENTELQHAYETKAGKRAGAIRTYFWDASKRYYMDYDFRKRDFTKAVTLAGAFPLFFKLASKPQARFVKAYIRLSFMKSGGLLTSRVKSGQQWDAPNGWAPLQWIVYKGLRNYDFHQIADELSAEWLGLIDKEFRHSGKMLEKYNVSDTNLIAGGGEYEVQEGFGWTNGVYLRMKNKRLFRTLEG
ncbi:alpha,alpha-trehalase TreA [Dyadobacter flavalbus]|uniref:Alpha,alpha-trehalase TreA n=1 Tax=Dyadobacter flavalbus TaxID=2579942 RepID=A0A5M8QSY2_9BACT|nr:alpha,alpha-trehalase TreA [Dyadobacter flavalbus]KAA6438351.1 alpha,alpha-trehalase TreA [Dyadobacter flavalbus]